MKTAVLISGHMRSFERCLPTLHWHVFRHFLPHDLNPQPNVCDFFVSTEPDEDARMAELLRVRYPQSKVEIDYMKQPEMEIPMTCPTEWRGPGQPYMHEPYAISVSPLAVLGQLWRLQRCWKFAAIQGGGYDVVIRCRPDLWMHSFRMPTLTADKPYSLGWTPWWGRFGGVNDRFAILGMDAARAYFTTYGAIPKLLKAGCALHPESLVKASLEMAGCTVDDGLEVEFSTLRKDGTMRGMEITAGDIVHAGRR